MTKKARVLVLEGLDRTGKDTLARRFSENAVFEFKHNNFDINLHREYYDITRSNMKSDNKEFVSRITNAMAISEYMQLLGFIKRYVGYGYDDFVVPRLFPSTIVFDAVRGAALTRLEEVILEIKKRFEEENDIEISMRLFTMFVQPQTMIERGSTKDSFEIKNYDKIAFHFAKYSERERLVHRVFEKALIANVDDMTIDEVYELAENFLFQS
ncbi:hypothetical protein PP939_gp214 [Rhizobium phage RL38J1]|uniref:Uncharacterized protein n=1 Tax=Rhizobium phage RL38J1 TaxID=2663232 RepID=A0A6B9J140_9CAUD|nr:hypothetical protein PP939_gp214 [Rhizobium phage RL38J1]QGZ13894.1 hypothetical protein RL38J1_214 [Rhizobium phage RL38J1]